MIYNLKVKVNVDDRLKQVISISILFLLWEFRFSRKLGFLSQVSLLGSSIGDINLNNKSFLFAHKHWEFLDKVGLDKLQEPICIDLSYIELLKLISNTSIITTQTQRFMV